MARLTYWTILIGTSPTAFRAKEPADLLPTLKQLQRVHPEAVMKWFQRGQVWDSPGAAEEARRKAFSNRERRPADWRPGGAHKDPRQRFKDAKKAKWATFRQERHDRRTRADRPADGERAPGGDRPWRDRERPRTERPRTERPPQTARPDRERPRADRPRTDRPRTDRPRGERPFDARGPRPPRPGGKDRRPPPSRERSGPPRESRAAGSDRRPPRPPRNDRASRPPRPPRAPRTAPPRHDETPPKKRRDED